MTQLSAEQFERAVSGSRLSERSRALARSVLVDGVALTQAAKAAGMSRQQAYQAKERVLQRHLATERLKLTAGAFMQRQPSRAALLRAFRGELVKLARAGYPPEVMVQYLKANAVEATPAEIERLLLPRGQRAGQALADGSAAPRGKAGVHEDRALRQPERRGRQDR